MSCHREDFLRAVGEAQARSAQGRFVEAFWVLASLDLDPDRAPEAVYYQATLGMRGRLWEEAFRLLDALIEVEPEQAIFHLDRAQCLIELGRLGEARIALREGGPMLRSHFRREVLLARIDTLGHDLSNALDHLSTACRLDSSALQMVLETPELVNLLKLAIQGFAQKHVANPFQQLDLLPPSLT